MKKREDWPEQANAFVAKVMKKPFVWGEFDCCLFAADCVQAMTGEDFAADFRGKYTDGPGGYQLLKEFSGGGIVATVEKLAERFEWTDIEPRRAQRGDIVLLPAALCGGDDRFDGALGICAGTVSLFVTEEAGVRATSTIPNPGAPGITRAWRIKAGRD